jgi:hypothetical protein
MIATLFERSDGWDNWTVIARGSKAIYHQAVKGDFMSGSGHSESWLEKWWGVLVVGYGLLFLSLLIFFHPRS